MSKSSRIVVRGGLGVAAVALVALVAWVAGSGDVVRGGASRSESSSALEEGFRAGGDGDGTLEAHGAGWQARVAADGWLSISAAGSTVPLSLRTSSARREQSEHHGALGATRLVAGVAERQVDTAREGFHAREHGVEQTWTFDAAPEGDGDLVVALDVRGLDYAGASASGLRFADARGAVLAYGHGTWIDARGTRTSVPAAFRDGRVELRVPGEVVGRSEYPAVLDPMIGPELPLDGTPTLVASNATKPAIACGTSGQCLAVWLRNGSVLMGARLDSAGALVDPVGYQLSDKNVSALDVAFTGTHYVVAFRDSSGNVYVSRFDPGGVVLARDVQVNATSGSTLASVGPVIAANASQSLVAWSTSTTVLAARVDASGSVLDGTAIAFTGTTGGPGPGVAVSQASSLAVATDGAAFLVVWNGQVLVTQGIYESTVSSLGGASTATNIASSSTSDMVRAVWQNSSYLVVWGASSLKLARVASNGAVGGGAGTAVSAYGSAGFSLSKNASNAELVFGAANFPSSTNIDVAHVTSTSDTAFDSGGFVATSGTTTGGNPDVDWNGNHFTTVWEGGGKVWLASYITTPASPLVGTTLGREAPNQGLVGGAWNGTSYWTVWVDSSAAHGTSVRARRIDVDGAFLDATPVTLRSSAFQDPNWIDIACNTAGRCAVAWSQADTIYASRLGPNGTLLDAQALVVRTGLANYSQQGSIASDGSGFLVSWLVGDVSTHDGCAARRMAADGTVDSADISVAASATQVGRGTFAGAAYFVPWYQKGQGVFVTRIGTDGSVQAGSPIAICPSTNSMCPQGDWATMDSDSKGDGVVVLATGGGPLLAVRLTPAGGILDAVPVTVESTNSWYEGAAWNGTDWVIGWQTSLSGPPVTFRAVAKTLSPTGVLSGTVDTLLESTAPTLVTLELVSGPARNVLALYSRRDDAPEYGGVYRLRGKLVSTRLAEGASCTAPTDCISSMCVGNLCTAPSIPDAGVGDGGTSDGGTTNDGGTVDDGGSTSGARTRPQTSYCAIGRGPSSPAALAFVAAATFLVLARRRRRSKRSATSRQVALLALLGALTTPAWTSPALAQADDQAEGAASNGAYDETIRQAVAEFEANRFEEARALFRQAHAIEPNARTLRGIGMSSFELRDYVDAALSFRAALADARRPLTSQQRTQTRNLLRQAELFVSHHPLDLAPATAAVRVDGAPATIVDGELWMNPGAHQLRVEAQGFVTRTEPIQANSGANPVLALHLEPSATSVAAPVPPPVVAPAAVAAAGVEAQPSPAPSADEAPHHARSRRRGLAFGLIGGGAAVAAGGMLAGGLILRNQDERLSGHCGASVGLPSGQCEDSAVVDDVDSKSQMARVLGFTSLGVGLGAAGAGVLLLVLKPHDADAPQRAVTPTAACGTEGCTVGAVGRF